MSANSRDLPVIVCGGGIGGLAAALALVRRGLSAVVLEQAPEIGEIGAGIQLGPNAFHAFDALGIGDRARGRAVYTDCMVMHDAIDETQIGKIETGDAFRKRFGNPYAVIHRADIHLSLLEGAQETGKVEFHTNTRIEKIEQDPVAKTVTAIDQNGQRWTGRALIGADGRAGFTLTPALSRRREREQCAGRRFSSSAASGRPQRRHCTSPSPARGRGPG